MRCGSLFVSLPNICKWILLSYSWKLQKEQLLLYPFLVPLLWVYPHWSQRADEKNWVQPFTHPCGLVKFWVSAWESVNMTLFTSKVRKNILLKGREKGHGYHSHSLLFFPSTRVLWHCFAVNHPETPSQASVFNDIHSVPSLMRALAGQIGVRMLFLQKAMT